MDEKELKSIRMKKIGEQIYLSRKKLRIYKRSFS